MISHSDWLDNLVKNLSGNAVQKISRLVALVFAVAALTAACGAGTSNEASFGESVEGVTSQSGGSQAGSSQSSAGSEAAGVADTDVDAVDDLSSPSSVPTHLFPDMDVIDIQTGATINLAAELAGGDTPILLWFWAPH